MLDLALQRRPVFTHRQEECRFAAKFMLRHYEDAIVTRAPSPEERQQLEDEIPGTTIQISVEQDQRLSSLRDQDSYSYEVAVVFIGGDSAEDLQAKYRQVLDRLPLEFSPVA